jgi:hypothetical protein
MTIKVPYLGILIPRMANELKYRLTELSDSLPRNVDLLAELEKNGITKSTYYRHRAIIQHSAQSISGDHLKIYAHFFNVSIEQLFTPVKKHSKKVTIKSPLK